MNISPEATKLIIAREIDKDRQNQLRDQAFERRMADLEADRDMWRMVAIWAIAFALIVPAYKIGSVAYPIITQILNR